ncbi:MAG: hypothetical protein ACTSVZ_01485 [Promethearchaeota archaeon]
MIFNPAFTIEPMAESLISDPSDTPDLEKKHPLSWLAKGKSIQSVLIILATLCVSILLTIVGFLIGVRAGGFQGEVFVMGDIQIVRGFLIAAGFIALATVIEYQFLK